jgi:hypothetical protein
MVRIEHGERSFAPTAGISLPAPNQAAQAAHRLVSAGAIMTLNEPAPEQHLVGYLEWLETRRLFWFTAYGESLADGHLLEFDAMHMDEDRGLCFATGGNVSATLTPIDQAKVEDPDDYRIAWQLWQEVAPLRRAKIEACCAALLRGRPADGLDGQVWRPPPTIVSLKSPRARRA